MTETPDKTPDELLKTVQKAHRGKLKLFFGAAPGVGKTYTMLQEAQEKRAQGLDVLVGWVDTHHRADTEMKLAGLTVLPRKIVKTADFTYEEFDIDAVLAKRPALVIVDELAHSNAPGSRHPKRWQDVEELLAAGIDVYSALNVQHLESLNDVVERMIGVDVRETVPDRLFDEADEVRLVDLPPADLIARLKAGKIYLKQTIPAALAGFFKKGNLLALRELSLRRMAQRADAENSARRPVEDRANPAGDAVLVWLTGPKGAEELVRDGARLAGSHQAVWHVVWFDGGTAGEKKRRRMLRALALADELGAATQILGGYEAESAVVGYAESHSVRTLMLMRDYLTFWRRRKLMRVAQDLRLLEVSVDVDEDPEDEDTGRLQTAATFFSVTERDGWWQSVLLTALTTALLYWLEPIIHPTNAVLMFLIPIMAAALRYGRGPAALVALLSAAAFVYVFVEPAFSFTVKDWSYGIVFFVLLAVGAGTGTLVSRLRTLSEEANDRTAHVRMLYTLSRELGQALMVEEVCETVGKYATSDFGAVVDLWTTGGTITDVKRLTFNIKNVDRSLVLWCMDHAEAAGRGTHTQPDSPYLYLPLKGQMRVHGAMVLSVADPDRWVNKEMRGIAAGMADSAASALERLHYVDVSQKTVVEMENDRFRQSLVQDLADELREPLDELSYGAEELSTQLAGSSAKQAPEARKLLADVRRMTRLTGNLLEMSRLQGAGFEPTLKKTAVADLLQEAVDDLTDAAKSRYRVTVTVDKACPAVNVDPELIRRLLANLLDNAVKYCPPGSAIELTGERAAENVLVSVTDNGPGLPEDDVNRLFDPFRRGDKKEGVTGVGLGLAVSRMIARVHGAQLIAKNNADGPGATFTLILPAVREDEEKKSESL